MAALAIAPSEYDEAVLKLARWQAWGWDQATTPSLQIYSFPDPARQSVRLIEVSNEFPDVGEVLPFPFGKSDQFPFGSAVALVSESDWAKIESGSIQLPNGWDLQSKQRVWP